MKFNFKEDAWIHVTPLGEYAHAGAGVVQVIDAEALKAITEDFTAKAAAENFPGLLVDFDHFSMDTDK
jgi:anti-anti-sigma regulatory factor